MTGAELQTRTLKRLGDDASAATMFYTPSEVLGVLNQAQRLFVLLTLCLETTDTFSLTGQATYRMLETFDDWMVPLRIRTSGGTKLKPCRLADLAALDTRWTSRTGAPERYAHLGFDLLGIYKQNSSTAIVTYARSPVDLTASAEAEIPERYHPKLIDGAIALARLKEGQQEFEKVTPLWQRFLSEVAECAGHVRARNIEQGYDRYPVELKRMDRSRLLQKVGMNG